MKQLQKVIEKVIFASRWILIACYIKLIWTLVRFVFDFATKSHDSRRVVDVLEDVDYVMIANLVKSIITGSYHSFVSKTHGYNEEKVSSGSLKVKMGTSLIGISSIYLLQVFLSLVVNIDWDILWKYMILHAAFLVSSLVLAIIEYIHCKSEYYEALTKHLEPETKEVPVKSMLPNKLKALQGPTVYY